MEFTGERVVPGKVEVDLFNEHLSRYYFAQTFTANRSVLDVGCGVGYGAAILAETADKVVAVDISRDAVEFARQNYRSSHLEFLVSDCCQLALESEKFDVAVCFEVIEHLTGQEQLLAEVSRVLKRDGILIVSTPNRVFYTTERQEVNPFHTREFDFAEFSVLLRRYFHNVEVAFENHVSSIFIGTSSASENVLSRVEASEESLEATSNFFVAVCSKSDAASSGFKSLLYLPAHSNLLREKTAWIRVLESRISELDQKVLRQQQEYDDKSQWCLKLNEEMQERTEWARRLDQRVKEQDARIAALQNQPKDLEKQLQERTAWAEHLGVEVSQKDQRIAALQAEFEERTTWAEHLGAEVSQKDQGIAALQAEFDHRTAWALQLKEESKATAEKLDRVKQTKLFRLCRKLGLIPEL